MLSRALLIASFFTLSAWTLSRAAAPSVRPFAPAVVIEGEPRECGHAYGKRFRDGIRAFLKKEIYDVFVGKPSTKEQLLAYAAACGKVLRTECPTIADEFAGIADGAGVTYDEIILINLHEELYHRTELPHAGHCTAVAVGPPDTRGKQTYVGQTWDWMESVAGMSEVMEWRRKGDVPVLAYGFPGMPTGAGLNASGIALCWTSANLGQKGQMPRVGIPSYALIAHLLAQPDIDSVIREARKNKHAGWFTFVLADGEGNLLNIEGSPNAVAIERPTGRLTRVGYGSKEMTGTKPDQTAPLHARCRKMYDHIDAAKGQMNLGLLQEHFAEPKHGINVGRATIDMMVFDTTARTAHLSRGTSYGVEWRRFGFDERR
jgi:isopenicillin-N N-acyltransferase-like protein